MTLKEAHEIIDRSTKMWPFRRLTDQEMIDLETAYNVVRQNEIEKLGEGRF